MQNTTKEERVINKGDKKTIKKEFIVWINRFLQRYN